MSSNTLANSGQSGKPYTMLIAPRETPSVFLAGLLFALLFALPVFAVDGPAPAEKVVARPSQISVAAQAGTVEIQVESENPAETQYSTAVISGDSWLTVTGGALGSIPGTIEASFQENTTRFPRTGQIRVIVSGGVYRDVLITQAERTQSETVDEDFEDGMANGWSMPGAEVWPAQSFDDITYNTSFLSVSPGLVVSNYAYAGTNAVTSPNLLWEVGAVEYDVRLGSVDSRLRFLLAVEDKRNYVMIDLGAAGADTPTDSIHLYILGSETYKASASSRLRAGVTHRLKITKDYDLVTVFVDGSQALSLNSGRIPDGPLAFYYVSHGKVTIDNFSGPFPTSILSVTPEQQEVGPFAGSADFSIQNMGEGTMDWRACIVSGADWLSISSATSGSDSGELEVAYTENESAEPRTGTIEVRAPKAEHGLAVLQVSQAGALAELSCLSVSPQSQKVKSGSGICALNVSNTGSGTMTWTAEVTSGASWLSIEFGSSGTNTKEITLSHTRNSSAKQRTAEVTITAEDAQDSPKVVTIVQEGSTGTGNGDSSLTGVCDSPVKRLDTNLREEVLPLSIDVAATEVLDAAFFSIRITCDEPIDPDTVWATATADGWAAEGARWRATSPESDCDGWVLLTLDEPVPAGTVLSMTSGAFTVAGREVGPITQEFMIAAGKALQTGGEAYVTDVTEIAPLPNLIASPASPVRRIGPAGAFDAPVRVSLPVPKGVAPEDLDVYYFSESALHPGWFPGDNVVGWLVPGSKRVVEEDGLLLVEFEVNHSGVFQLGKSVEVGFGGVGKVTVGAQGSPLQWTLYAGLLVALALALRRCAFGSRQGC